MCVAAAIAGAAVVGAGATLYASDQASSATKDASNAAIQQQQSALAQQKEMAQPYTDLGKQAIPTLENLLGIGKPGGPSAQATLENMPGYQFAKQQGIDATKAGAASMGLALSGNTLAGIDQYSTGLASQTYENEINNLYRVAGLGQASAAGQAANIQAGASNIGNIGINQANTLSGIRSNEAAGIGNIAGNLGGSLAMNNIMNPAGSPYRAGMPGAGLGSISGLPSGMDGSVLPTSIGGGMPALDISVPFIA